MYQFYLRKYAGVDEETGVALYYKDITDANGNVTGQEKTQNWSDATRHATGDILPKVYGGFGTRLNVYGFDFAISLAYQLGGRVYDNGYVSLMHAGDDPGQNWHKDILNAWTPENKTSNIPQINVFAQYANSLSDRFLTSSDYLSINNITVGYTLPKNWTRKMLISSMRIYMAADNVALFSARKGLDPRQSYTASSADVYSPIRTISGGITLSF
jgi:TonB dependent receptor.